MVRRGVMRQVLCAMALVAALTSADEASAVMRGEPARDPNGTRRSTVLIETPEGICTGAIVGPDLVLTAGHCVSARGRYRVRYLDRGFRRHAVAVARTANDALRRIGASSDARTDARLRAAITCARSTTVPSAAAYVRVTCASVGSALASNT